MKKNTGFSVLELVIVMSIIVLLSTIILANYSSFGERLAVRRAAEDIASSVRQVQAYGLAVREFDGNQFPGYGIYFSTSDLGHYIIYADLNKDYLYQTGEGIQTLAIQGNGRVYSFCANVKSNPPGNCGLTNISAAYTRPTPMVSLKGSGSPNCSVSPGSYCDLEVKIRGTKGTTRTIVIWLSGQVSTEEP